MKNNQFQTPKTLIIACGGSGGHIYPGLAIAKQLEKQYQNVKIIFIGCLGRMEMDIVPKHGYKIIGLEAKSLKRKRIFYNIFLPLNILKNMLLAYKIIKANKPAVVIGTGGFASFATVMAAFLARIPTVIHESNATFGLANKILSFFVSRVCISYRGLANASSKSILLTGTPIRTDLGNYDRKTALDAFSLDASRPCLLVLGGSLGAKNINAITLESLPSLIDLQLIWITGKGDYSQIKAVLSEDYASSVKVYPFVDNIALAYAAADIIISRAGALTVAEICTIQKPTIFVPSPNVTNNHQAKNIEQLVRDGAVIEIKDENLDRDFLKTTLSLMQNKTQQQEMTKKFGNWEHKNAAKNIVEAINQLFT